MSESETRSPAKLFEYVSKCGISTPQQILTLSKWDIKKDTYLNIDDIALLKDLAADFIFKSSILRGEELLRIEPPKISSGCVHLDNFLGGGFRPGTITEIYGESGSGKTQICISAGLHNWKIGAVYICTEDAFPMVRFNQMKESLSDYDPAINYGEKIFVDHITEQADLASCIKVRLPKLIEICQAGLIIVDSIAAPFRSETTDYVQRAQDLRDIAIALIETAKKVNAAVICVNQVSSACDSVKEQVIPCLGLAWANMISTRICINKTSEVIQQNNFIRELNIVFCPYLPNKKFKFAITSAGIINC